jgi:hypothetical protein
VGGTAGTNGGTAGVDHASGRASETEANDSAGAGGSAGAAGVDGGDAGGAGAAWQRRTTNSGAWSAQLEADRNEHRVLPSGHGGERSHRWLDAGYLVQTVERLGRAGAGWAFRTDRQRVWTTYGSHSGGLSDVGDVAA